MAVGIFVFLDEHVVEVSGAPHRADVVAQLLGVELLADRGEQDRADRVGLDLQ